MDVKIANLIGEVYKFIKQIYFGGAVYVYKPSGKNVFYYDVNSLYAFIMRKTKMPVGLPTLLVGNNSLIETIVKDSNKFSFVEVDVFCPENLKVPLLLHKINNKTVAPTGKWRGVYTNIEINRAIELGYKFKYRKCVHFECKNIFTAYVDFYYELKKNSDKNSSAYTIAKLMLNSLSGRFGMNPNLDQHVISKGNDINKLIEKHTIKNIIPLSFGKELITFSHDSGLMDDLPENQRNYNTNIAIAAAITAGARVYMSYFKNMEDINIYYSDTDSICTDTPLDPKYVGGELGQFKLEHQFDEAVFLAPKVWGGKNKYYETVKVKGLKNPVKYDLLKTLLKKGNSLQNPNEIWYKDISKGQIIVKDEIYTLSVTDNKRQLIYDGNNNFVDTKPIHINEIDSF